MSTALTPEEFKLILSCLHPDREAPIERKTKAFAIFKRLEPGAEPTPPTPPMPPTPPTPPMRPAQRAAPMPPIKRKPRL